MLVIMTILIVIIILCVIGIIMASIFQSKKEKKYIECLNIIKEKELQTFQLKDSMTPQEILNMDSEINFDKLMLDLYDKYLLFEEKLSKRDTNLENLLTEKTKKFYILKLESLKSRDCFDITEGIELVNYSIIEFAKNKLKFRIIINCFCYKKYKDKIVSGSNLYKLEKVLILNYEKEDNEWLISDYKVIYEKKLSD